MRVLILYAKYGGGHMSAANSLRTYIEENYLDTDIQFIDCVEEVSSFLNNITIKAYNFMSKKAPKLWSKVYFASPKGLVYKVSDSSKKILSNKLLHKLKVFLPDIIISTHFFGTQIISYLKEKGEIDCKLATVLTDFASHSQSLIGKDYCDYFFVSNENLKKELIDNNIPAEKIHVTGIPISNRFSQEHDTEALYRRFNLDKNKKLILFFGNCSCGLHLKKSISVLRALSNHLDNYQIFAVSCMNETLNNEFIKLSNELNNPDLHIFKYTTEVPEIMSISSLVVSKPGGLTSSEALASHLPMIIINPIPGQEEENAEFLENSGAAIWIKKDDNIEEKIDNILNNPEILNNMKQNTFKISHLYATRDICKILFDDFYNK